MSYFTPSLLVLESCSLTGYVYEKVVGKALVDDTSPNPMRPLLGQERVH